MNREDNTTWYPLSPELIEDGGIEPGVIDEEDLIDYDLCKQNEDDSTTEGLTSLIADEVACQRLAKCIHHRRRKK